MAEAKKENKKEEKQVGKSKFTKDELKAMAKDVFKRIKKEVVYSCTDGQFFLSENHAMEHARKNKYEVLEHKA